MKINTYTMKPAPENPTSHHVDNILYRDDIAILHEFLPKGAEVPPHVVPYGVFIMILKGSLKVTIGDQYRQSHPAGTVVEVPYATQAGVKNEDDETAEIFVIKVNNKPADE
jgi:quercetin dioxygenase-like cupin family protein